MPILHFLEKPNKMIRWSYYSSKWDDNKAPLGNRPGHRPGHRPRKAHWFKANVLKLLHIKPPLAPSQSDSNTCRKRYYLKGFATWVLAGPCGPSLQEYVRKRKRTAYAVEPGLRYEGHQATYRPLITSKTKFRYKQPWKNLQADSAWRRKMKFLMVAPGVNQALQWDTG